MSDRFDFPSGFLWGVATSAHQVEGQNVLNQWWDWERRGKLHTPDTSMLALDWWRDPEPDLDLARGLSLNAVRLSVEWSRVEPAAEAWSEAALDRYREILLALTARGLTPMVTLHHFTDPMWFAARGGWENPEAPALFARFVGRVVERLGDLCQLWCTINEPNIYVLCGYFLGTFPPGRKGDLPGAMRVSAAMIDAHARAYREIHRLRSTAVVGWAQNFNTFDPKDPASPLDRAVVAVRDGVLNQLMVRAVIDGTVPRVLRPVVGDVSAAKGTFDYVGINTYYRDVVRFDPVNVAELFGTHVPTPGAPRSDQPPAGHAWGEVYPQGILRIAEQLRGSGRPVYVTESGVADRDDRLRPWVLASGVRAMADALARGIDVKGYFHWTLVDNFEWAEGFSCRFGLYELDLTTRARRQRRSAELYRTIASANGLVREQLRPFGAEVEAAAFP